MRIKSVQIKNFRALRDVEIDFDDVTTLIGPNGAGKSTVLRALDWFFNGKAGGLTSDDCSTGNASSEIEVAVTFDGLTDDDRHALGKYAPDGTDLFKVWRTWTSEKGDVLSANCKSFALFTAIRSATKWADKRDQYNSLAQHEPDLLLPTCKSAADVEAALVEWERKNPDRLTTAPEETQTELFGFNGQSTLDSLFSYVFVSADLRAADEAVDVKSTLIGRLLERAIDRNSVNGDLERASHEYHEQQRRIFNNGFSDQLVRIERRLTEQVGSYASGYSMRIRPVSTEPKAPRASFDLGVSVGDLETTIDRQGHGFQRALLLSVLQVLADSASDSRAGSLCLAIEEPELFQHPARAVCFAKVLRALAEDPAQQTQVAYATHSPYFLEPTHLHQVRRFSASSSESGSTAIRSLRTEALRDRLQDVMTPEVMHRRLGGFVATELSAALFAERVLIVEGSTDAAVVLGLGDRRRPGLLESMGIAVVAFPKSEIPFAHAVLVELGIATFVLLDSDSGFEKRMKDGADLETTRSQHAKANQRCFRYLGIEAADFPGRLVSGRIFVFDDCLETYLESFWPEWCVLKDEIASVLGLSSATKTMKNANLYRVATLETIESPPAFLQELVDALVDGQ